MWFYGGRIYKYQNINKKQKVKKLEKRKRRLQRSVSRSYEKNKKGVSYCKTSNVIKKFMNLGDSLNINQRGIISVSFKVVKPYLSM